MTTAVVVPVKNEERIILDFLRIVLRQTQLPNQVILVDNGSKDHTVRLIERCIPEYRQRGVELMLLECSTGNQIEARQMGFAAASTELVITADADTRFHPQWIARAQKVFQEHPEVVGAGGCNIYNRLFVTLTHSFVFLFGMLFRSRYFFYGSNGVFRASAYRDSSGLSGCRSYMEKHALHEPYDDVWLSFQLKKQGKLIPVRRLQAFCMSRMRYPREQSMNREQRMYWQVKETLALQRALRNQDT